MRFLGVPYQWGGVTPKGVDCSGLVQTVFRLHGVLLPRDARDQCRWAKRNGYLYRDPEAVQPGHLLFFGEGERSVNHVGIALGGGRILHARGRVRIDSLRAGDDAYAPGLAGLFLAAGAVLMD
jgi:cell wall-associated NlpC family hydrolase